MRHRPNSRKKNPLSDSKSGVPGYPRDGVLAPSRESAEVNRKRASSGPIKVVVTNQSHSRRHTGVDLVSGTTALFAWFPASWASKIAPCFVGESDGSTQAHRRFPSLVPIVIYQLQSMGFFFPEEAHGLQLIYNSLEADLQQVELDGQRITQMMSDHFG